MAGTTKDDTSPVGEAAFPFSDESLSWNTVVKLTHTMMIIPVTLVLAFSRKRSSDKKSGTIHFRRIIRKFVPGFLAASFVSAVTLIPVEACAILDDVG